MNEIENMLIEAWKKFCDYYDTMAPRYRDSFYPEHNEQGAEDSHWICWCENDLVFHIGRFFYDILREKNKSESPNIEIHFDKKVDQINFDGYMFVDNLDELRERLIREGVLRRGAPKVDMIIAKEDSDASLLLCAEVKCFRGTRFERPMEDIPIDRQKLNAYRDLGIAETVVFIVFDDHYYYNDEETSNAILQMLEEIENEDGITVLYHTSKEKLYN